MAEENDISRERSELLDAIIAALAEDNRGGADHLLGLYAGKAYNAGWADALKHLRGHIEKLQGE